MKNTPTGRHPPCPVVVGPVVVLHGEIINAALDGVLRVAHACDRNGQPPARVVAGKLLPIPTARREVS